MMSDAEDDYDDDGFEHYEFSAEKATKISIDTTTTVNQKINEEAPLLAAKSM